MNTERAEAEVKLKDAKFKRDLAVDQLIQCSDSYLHEAIQEVLDAEREIIAWTL